MKYVKFLCSPVLLSDHLKCSLNLSYITLAMSVAMLSDMLCSLTVNNTLCI